MIFPSPEIRSLPLSYLRFPRTYLPGRENFLLTLPFSCAQGVLRSALKKTYIIPEYPLILSCVQVEAIEKSGEVTSPHPAIFGRARLRATKRSALPAVAQHLLGPAAAPYRAGSWSGHGELRGGAPSQKIGRELEASSIGSMCKREPERSEGSEGKYPPNPRAFQLFLVLT